MSVSWPRRCWHESIASTHEMSDISRNITVISKNCTFPVWMSESISTSQLRKVLRDNGFEIVLEQLAMYKDMENYPLGTCSDLELVRAKSQKDIEVWTNTAAISFGYEIDISVIRKIALNPDVQLVLAHIKHYPAATAMLFKTGSILGIHQVGVLPEYRGKGIARKLMQDVMNQCSQLAVRYITLQASAAGKSLYQSLGFKPQFKIHSYQRAINNI